MDKELERPYVGQKVTLVHLMHEGKFPGEIVKVVSFITTWCTVKLECQEELVQNVLYYDEEPEVVSSRLMQICFPRKEQYETISQEETSPEA